jgi:hypothetical protein
MKRGWTDVPESSKRAMRVLACGMGAVLLVAAALPVPNDGAVVSLSVVPASSQAHVIIGVDGAVSVKDFALIDAPSCVLQQRAHRSFCFDLKRSQSGFGHGFFPIARR